MRKTVGFFVVIFFLFSSFLFYSEETARVFLSGYTRLDDFYVSFPNGGKLTVNGKRADIKGFTVGCSEKIIFTDGGKRLPIDEILYLPSKKEDGFQLSCIYGYQQYSGGFVIRRVGDTLLFINQLPVEELFPAILGAEAGDSFSQEALKAMSVAIRSYYYYRKKWNIKREYDIDGADGRDMVYRGKGFATEKMREICRSTQGVVLRTTTGEVYCSLYHSTSGGVILVNEVLTSSFTDSPTEPVATEDMIDGKLLPELSRYFSFETVIPEEIVYQALGLEEREVGKIRVKYFHQTECVDFIGVDLPGKGTHWIKGYRFVSNCQRRGYYGLRSIQFRITKEVDSFRFEGRGFGHLCGMSQWSGEAMARMGYSWQDILKKYYPDALF